MKTCILCNDSKPDSDFREKRNQCRLCECALREKHKTQKLANQGHKCGTCGVTDRLLFFPLTPDICKICSQSLKRKRVHKNPERYLLKQIKSRCRRDGRKCNLTVQDIVIPKCCPVFGFPLVITNMLAGGIRGADDIPSPDRIDNDLDYLKGNVRIISWKANQIKGEATIEELKAIVKYMEEHDA